jgi:hypothetical protein
MKSFPVCSVFALLLLAGCSSEVLETVKGPMPIGAPDQRQTEQTFAADPRTTYAAAKAALAQMGLRYVRGGPSQGELEAISDVSAAELPGSAHQFTLKAEFHPSLDGASTIVSLQMTEVVEDDSLHHQGEGTENVLRDPALYQAFFSYLQEQLSHRPAP